MKKYKGKQRATDFEQLHRDIMSDHHPVDPDCDFCLKNLDLYITDKLNGDDVKTIYPQIWEHLQLCSQCRLAYQTLYEMLATPALIEEFMDTAPVKPTLTPTDLTFLKPQAQNVPWHTRLRSQLSGAPFNITIEFNPGYLQTLFLQPQLSTVRQVVSSSTPKPQLLLHQILEIGDQKFTVDVTYLYSLAQSGNVKLEAALIGGQENILPSNLWASLVWAGQKREVPVTSNGYVNFGEVSLASLKNAVEAGISDFKINFSTKDNIEP